jgi:hypothetical protein
MISAVSFFHPPHFYHLHLMDILPREDTCAAVEAPSRADSASWRWGTMKRVERITHGDGTQTVKRGHAPRRTS